MDIYIELADPRKPCSRCQDQAVYEFICEDSKRFNGDFCATCGAELYEEAHSHHWHTWHQPIGDNESTEDMLDGSYMKATNSEALAKPKVVCLCGSTRFWRTFQKAGLQETLAGNIVLSIGAASGTDDDHFGNLPRDEYDRVKAMLDELHLRKIDMADEVLILNVDGYIGESTRRELNYAIAQNKIVRYWETAVSEEE